MNSTCRHAAGNVALSGVGVRNEHPCGWRAALGAPPGAEASGRCARSSTCARFPSLTGVAAGLARPHGAQLSVLHVPSPRRARARLHACLCARSVRALCHQSQGTRGRCCGKRPIWPTGCSPRSTRRRASLLARSTCALACRKTSPPRRPSLAPARSVSAHGCLAGAPLVL